MKPEVPEQAENLTPAPFLPNREGEYPSPSRGGAGVSSPTSFANRNPWESSRRALEGFYEYMRHSRRNWLYQAAISIAVVGLALWTGLDAVRVALVILSIALVLALEMLNTALEVLLNWVQPEYHRAAKTVKDLAAGAVLVVSVGAVGAGLVLFWAPLGLPDESFVVRMVESALLVLFGGLAWVGLRAKG